MGYGIYVINENKKDELIMHFQTPDLRLLEDASPEMALFFDTINENEEECPPNRYVCLIPVFENALKNHEKQPKGSAANPKLLFRKEDTYLSDVVKTCLNAMKKAKAENKKIAYL